MGEHPNSAASAFQREWAQHHGGRYPLGWLLREDTSLPWVRFHALPDSKRYAQNNRERRIVLDRANSLGNRLLGRGGSCWLVEANPDKIEDDAIFGGAYTPVDPDDRHCSFYARAVEWQPEAFDALIAKIADDITGPTLWMNRETGSLFAPYDGGFDCFPTSWDEVSALRVSLVAWLSSHPDGL